MKVKIQKANENDFLDVFNFVSNCKPLENYSEHFYKIILRYFGNSCFIAKDDNKIVGFLMGFKSQTDNEKIFLWQIGVLKSYRGKKIGKKLLKEFEKTANRLNCRIIEVTVDPENIESQKLFEKNEFINVSSDEGESIRILNKETVKDYYKPGRHFIIYHKNIC